MNPLSKKKKKTFVGKYYFSRTILIRSKGQYLKTGFGAIASKALFPIGHRLLLRKETEHKQRQREREKQNPDRFLRDNTKRISDGSPSSYSCTTKRSVAASNLIFFSLFFLFWRIFSLISRVGCGWSCINSCRCVYFWILGFLKTWFSSDLCVHWQFFQILVIDFWVSLFTTLLYFLFFEILCIIKSVFFFFFFCGIYWSLSL